MPRWHDAAINVQQLVVVITSCASRKVPIPIANALCSISKLPIAFWRLWLFHKFPAVAAKGGHFTIVSISCWHPPIP
jgi:hypothetical protein